MPPAARVRAVHKIKYRTLRQNREFQASEGLVEQSSGPSLLDRFYFPLLCSFRLRQTSHSFVNGKTFPGVDGESCVSRQKGQSQRHPEPFVGKANCRRVFFFLERVDDALDLVTVDLRDHLPVGFFGEISEKS